MLDNIKISNSAVFASVKRINRDDVMNLQKQFAVSLDSSGLIWKVAYSKLIKSKPAVGERLILIDAMNARLNKDNSRLFISEVFDDYGITVRIEFNVAIKLQKDATPEKADDKISTIQTTPAMQDVELEKFDELNQ